MKKETKEVKSIFNKYRKDKELLDSYEQVTSPSMNPDGVFHRGNNWIENEMIKRSDISLNCRYVDNAISAVSNPIHRIILRVYMIGRLCKASYLSEMFEMSPRTFQYHRNKAVEEFYNNYSRMRRIEN